MKRSRITYIFLLMLLPLWALAQRISLHGPTSVAVGQQFQVQYSVSTTDVKNFRMGNIPDAIQVLYGPSTSTQQSFSMVNGKVSQSSSVTYTYVFLATKNGTFVIPAAHAVVAGSNVSSPALKINVSGRAQANNGGGNAQQGRAQQQSTQPVKTSGHIGANDLFIRVTASKQRVHEQEPILVTYKVYTLVDLTQLDYKMPNVNGFHIQEIELPQQKQFHIENVNGRPYNCVTWSQYVMFPQMSGKLEIPSLTFKGIVQQRNPNVDPFEEFFNGGSGYVEVKKEIVAPGLSIQVDPLPAKPTNFSGGVGSFNVSASLDKSTVKAGDPVNLHFVVSGTGNLKLIKQPEINLPKDFDKYDPKVTDKTKITAEGLTGSMIYDMLIVPRNKGEYTIPSTEFVYYDTKTSSYKTVKTQPLTLIVERGSNNGGSSVDYSRNDNDISGLITDTSTKQDPQNTFFGSMAYMLIYSLVVVVFIVLLIIFRKRAAALADTVGTRGKKANKVAVKRLKKAARLMKENKKTEFFDETLRALWGYVGDKLSMPVEQLSRDNISEKLQQRTVDSDVVTSFIEAIDECEFARYAPSGDDNSVVMQKTYDKATDAITKMEGVMKRGKTKVSSATMSIILLFVLSLLSLPIDATEAFKANADAAYREGDYQKAITLYQQDLKSGITAETMHNLGNAYYRTDNIPMAVLYYERALKLAPADSRIQHSLDIARNKTVDRLPGESEMFFTEWYKAVVSSMSIDGWAVLGVVSLGLALLLLLVYLFIDDALLSRLAFYGFVGLLIILLIANLFAWQQKYWLINHDAAVVMSSQVSVKSSPTDKSTEAFVIHEGTKVIITDTDMKNWLGIRLSDGREGWINPKDAEEI